MARYVVRVLSFHKHPYEIAQEVLNCPVVERLLFPARLPMAPGKGVLLESARQFDIALVPGEFYAESLVNVPLYGENGIEFSCTIYQRARYSPNVVNLKFSPTHLLQNDVTYADLKALITQLVPVFRPDQVTIYDADIGQYRRSRYFIGPDQKRYPYQLGWISYFGAELVAFLGREKFAGLKSCTEMADLFGGILIALQEEPLRAEDDLHRDLEERALMELSLEEFLK